MSPWTELQKHFFGLCSSSAGRAKARSKCPPQAQAKRLSSEAASLPTLPPKRRAKKRR